MASPFLNPVMTLTEYSKGPDIPDQARPLIEMFAQSSDIIDALPFLGLGGFFYQGYRQAALQNTMAFRAVNAASTSGAGTGHERVLRAGHGRCQQHADLSVVASNSAGDSLPATSAPVGPVTTASPGMFNSAAASALLVPLGLAA